MFKSDAEQLGFDTMVDHGHGLCEFYNPYNPMTQEYLDFEHGADLAELTIDEG